MTDFKQETLETLEKHFGKDYQIDSYRFFHDNNSVEGRDKIDWNKVKKKLCFESGFEYYSGYGADEVTGFITVKNHDGWLERVTYDGSSWWVYKHRPVL